MTDLWPSRSQRLDRAEALGREKELKWVKPMADAPPWLREAFVRRRSDVPHLWAFTVDFRGCIIRAFYADPRCIAAYAKLRQQGIGTCPIEGVWVPSIAAGRSAEPAHPFLEEFF